MGLYARASCKTYFCASRKVRYVRKAAMRAKLRVLCELGVRYFLGFCNYLSPLQGAAEIRTGPNNNYGY